MPLENTMSKDEWYRNTNWTERIEKEFFTRLGKSRSVFNKAQYLRIQASYLESNYVETALRLLNIVLNEYPDPAELAQTHHQIATCYEQIGDADKVVFNFRKALECEDKYPKAITQSWIDFPYFIIRSKMSELFPEAEILLKKRKPDILFPIDNYKINSVFAMICKYNGDKLNSRLYAKKALDYATITDNGLQYKSNVGLVKKVDESIHLQLINLAAA